MFALMLLVTALGLASCDITDNNPETSEIEIGVVLPLTGTLTRTGSEMRQAIEMARDLANEANLIPNYKIKLEIRDDQSNVDRTEEVFKELISTGRTAAIIGPYTSSATARIIPLVDEAGIVSLGPSSAALGLSAMSSYLFRTTLTVGNLVPEGIRVSKDKLGYQSAALITNESDTFSKSARDEIKEELGKISGVKIVAEETFVRTPGSGSPDVTRQLTSILNATPKPEVLFICGLTPDRINVVTTARSVGIVDIPMVTTLMSVDDVRRINEITPGAAEGLISFTVWLASSTHPASISFVNAYRERYLETPGDFAARAFAGTNLLFKGIAAALPDRSAAGIRDALAGFENIDTIYGSFSFDENGDALYSPSVVQVQGEGFVLFK